MKDYKYKIGDVVELTGDEKISIKNAIDNIDAAYEAFGVASKMLKSSKEELWDRLEQLRLGIIDQYHLNINHEKIECRVLRRKD